MEVTAQPRWTAALHMRLPARVREQLKETHQLGERRVPRKPFPPQTTSFFFTADAIAVSCEEGAPAQNAKSLTSFYRAAEMRL